MIQYDIHLILASSVASAGGKGLKNGGVSKCSAGLTGLRASRAYGPWQLPGPISQGSGFFLNGLGLEVVSCEPWKD